MLGVNYQKLVALFFDFSLVIIFFGAGPGPQPSSAPLSSGTVDFQKDGVDSRVVSDSEFIKAGHRDYFLRANETITIQMDYILKKSNFLSDPNSPEPQRRALLGGFCHQLNPKIPEDNEEELETCVDRWQRVNQFWLLKARGALGKNQGAVGQLGGVTCEGGNCTAHSSKNGVQAGVGLKKNSVQVPEFPKYGQAPALLKAQQLATKAADSQWKKFYDVHDISQMGSWADLQIQQFRPSRDDFVKFKTVPVNPDQPAAGNIEVPLMKADGSLEYDDIAYKMALAYFKQHFMDDTNATATSGDGRVVKKNADNKKQMIQDFSASPKDPNKSVSRQLYDAAHDEFVQDSNRAVLGQSSTVSYPGTVARGGPNAQASGTPHAEPLNGNLDHLYQLSTSTSNNSGASGQGSRADLSPTKYFSVSTSYHGSQITFAPPTPGTPPSPTPSSGHSFPGTLGAPNSSPPQNLNGVTDNLMLDFNEDIN